MRLSLRPIALMVLSGVLAAHPIHAQTPAAPTAKSAAAPLNVNTASAAELEALPGIGPALAQRIIEYRKQQGPFRRAEDLLGVKGVGAKMLAKIKDRFTFDAPSEKK